VFSATIAGKAYARHGTNMETRLTVIDRVPAENPAVFPPAPSMAADTAELLGQVQSLVPPRVPIAAPPPLLPPTMFPRPAGSAARPNLPQLALVKRPARLTDAVELAYETREWAPGETRFSASLYEAYALQTIHFPAAQPHPTKLAQSAAMAAVA